MKKFYMAKSLKAEEDWINHIQEKGFRLVKINPYIGSYTFEKRKDEDFFPTVRLDFHQYMKQADYDDYLSIFTDSGWTLLKGSVKDSVNYFQKTAQATEDVIFSDNESQLAFYKRNKQQAWRSFFVFFALALSWIPISNYQMGMNLSHPKSLFLTPHLWEMTGLRFYLSFIFELFFVVPFRTPFMCLLMIAAAIFYLYQIYQIKKLIKKQNTIVD